MYEYKNYRTICQSNNIVLAAYFKVLKMKLNRVEKLRSDGCCN